MNLDLMITCEYLRDRTEKCFIRDAAFVFSIVGSQHVLNGCLECSMMAIHWVAFITKKKTLQGKQIESACLLTDFQIFLAGENQFKLLCHKTPSFLLRKFMCVN